MSHYYKNTGLLTQIDSDVKTPAQARKAEGIRYASITTKLQYLKSDMDHWKDSTIVKLARKHPTMPLADLQALRWGVRRTPDGGCMPSSDFGTRVHKLLEDYWKCGADINLDGWGKYIEPFYEWVDFEEIEITEMEKVVWSDRYRTAGTIDGIGLDCGKVILWDYKTRGGSSELSSRHYLKDCAQLAIAADIFKDQYNLDYLPRIYTIIIDVVTGETYPKLWTEKAQAKGYSTFVNVSNFYDAQYA